MGLGPLEHAIARMHSADATARMHSAHAIARMRSASNTALPSSSLRSVSLRAGAEKDGVFHPDGWESTVGALLFSRGHLSFL